MTNYRKLLLSFLTVSWVFLSGFNKPVENDRLSEETQKTEAELKSIETEYNTRKLQETKQVKAKGSIKSVELKPQSTNKATNASSVTDDNSPIKRNEFEKPLDLSIPFKTTENAGMKVEQKSAAQSRQETTIFAPEPKKKPRSLELDGDFLMSPEPEAEKQKSVDGAGIVIKLKP